MEEICEKLQGTDRSAKLQVLQQLQEKCSASRDGGNLVELQKIFDECYLYLLKCYSDKFESVREQSVATINAFLAVMPPNDFHLLNVSATLASLMGQEETIEKSEEIRLLFVDQLLKMVLRFIQMDCKRSLEECYSDIVRVLNNGVRDSYPAVQRTSCSCISALAAAADCYSFQKYCPTLAKSLYRMLNHKHSPGRIAAVNALSYIALIIDVKNDALSNLLMEVSPLLMDSMPLVRRECGDFGVRLLLELKDRYSFFERLIPFVLCCLKDDSEEVRNYIMPLWVKCGKQYYEENETELSKQELADIQPINYPANVQRPTIGCRGIVQRSLRLLKLITRETSDWKENVRLHSLKLLYQFVLHAEATMTAKFFEIYADVARACRDAEAAVVQEAFKVCDLMGRLLKYEDWREHGLEGLHKNSTEGYLKCFYYMYTSAINMKFEDNLTLSNIMVSKEYSQSLKSEMQMYVIKMIETLLEKVSKEDHQISSPIEDDKFHQFYKNCYISTVKVLAISIESTESNRDQLQEKGRSILNEICKHCNILENELHEKYCDEAFQYVDNIDAALDALSEPILLFYGLIKLIKFREPSLQQIQTKMNVVFSECADESKLKILSGVSIAMLDWNASIQRPIEKSCELLQEFITSVIEQHLEWRAGANAEGMRSMATAALCAISQGAAQEARIVLPNFAKYMPNLLEDHSAATRHYAIKCLNNFGDVPMEAMKPIAYGCIQRLDDPSSDIRILAASVIIKLQPKLDYWPEETEENKKKNEFETEIWHSFVKRAMKAMFLHYDGPDIPLKSAIKETLMEMSKRYPVIAKESYIRTMIITHNSLNLKELKNELPSID